MVLPCGRCVVVLGYVGDTDTKGYKMSKLGPDLSDMLLGNAPKYDGWLVLYKEVRPGGRVGNNSEKFPTYTEAKKFAETLGDKLVNVSQYVDATETNRYTK